jgi:hypothetical protein
MPALCPKAVSRLRLATAVQDAPDFSGIHRELVCQMKWQAVFVFQIVPTGFASFASFA